MKLRLARGLLSIGLSILLLAGCGGHRKAPEGGLEAREQDVQQDRKAALKTAQQAVATAWETPASKVKVREIDGVTAPGVVVFLAQRADGKSQRGTWAAGVVTAEGVELDRDAAMAKVLRAWGYGSERAATPDAVARALGPLETRAEPTEPVLEPRDIAFIHPKWRPHVFLPREVTIDGLPGIEYWNRSGHPPLWRTRILVRPDGSIDLSKVSIQDWKAE